MVVVVPRGLQASVVAPAEPVLAAVRGEGEAAQEEAEAVQGAEVVAVEGVEDAGDHDWKNGILERWNDGSSTFQYSNIPAILDSTPYLI